nr:hypothetical protein [Tanacetum cinerariifolium]
MRRVGKGFSGVDTPLFEGMLVPQQVHVDIDAAAEDEDAAKPTSPAPTTTPPSLKQELIPSASQVAPTPPPSPHQSPITPPSSPLPQQPPSHDATYPWISLINCWRHGRLEESQAHVYHLDLKHAQKVLSMQDDEAEPTELTEVIEVVTTAKLMTEVVTAGGATTDATTFTAAPMLTASATRRRKGVVIRDHEETATPSFIVHSEPKSKDKGKGILVEEPKPLKKQAQIEQDEAYARELEVELNANINWNEVIEQVKRKEKQDNAVMRYQALKKKPQTEAQARKNMMVYLKNMAGFKMDFFKGMSYDEIRPIFEKHFNSIVAFLEKGKKELEEEASNVIKRKSETSKEKAAKKQKLDEEVEELKTHLQIVPNDEDDVYIEATLLALKVPVVDY